MAEEEDEYEEIEEYGEIADANTEMILTSPGYDGTTKYDTELDQVHLSNILSFFGFTNILFYYLYQENTYEAGPGKHFLLQFTDMDIEEGRRYEGCIYDWVEVRSNNTAITEKTGDKYCGTRAPSEPILSKGKEMSVLFHSDRVNEGTGFRASLFEGISQTLLDTSANF